MSMTSLEDCKDEDNEKQDEETKEEKIGDSDEAYNRKLEEMQNYLPFLEMMIQKLEHSKKDSDFREAQMLKIRSLHRILFSSKRRLKMETLIKCEAVLRNLQEKLKGCCLFLQEKDDTQKTDEESSAKDSEVVNTDSEHRTVKLESDGNITIDKHYQCSDTKKMTDKKTEDDKKVMKGKETTGKLIKRKLRL